jgi:hypothetical protein
MARHIRREFMRIKTLFIALALAATAGAASAEKLCGWIENPTPGNWWLTDRDGSWILAAQGGAEAEGMDLIGDISAGDYVATNGNYGYGCACVDAEVDVGESRIVSISSFKQLPLKTCKRDTSLRPPGE